VHLLYPAKGEILKQKIKENGIDRYVNKFLGFKLAIMFFRHA